jgi:uncharacterized repeat protein (TIGR02543 family)
VAAAFLVVSSIVGFAGPVSAIGVAPWVGVAGPGGGTVYYYNANGFACGVEFANTCHFLEVAGSDWDAKNRKWSSNNHSVAGTSIALGSGAKNTSLIVAENSTLGYAASDANAFVSDTGLGDWFLPSKDETSSMRGASYSTNFGEVGTSSQVNASWWHTYDSQRNSFPSNSPKGEAFKVLAVRAFSKSDSRLASVSVAGEVISPGFDPSVTSYAVTTDEPSIQVTAVAVGASSVLVGANSSTTSIGNGTQSGAIALEPGLNHVTLTVTAADSTSTVYTLNITREMPGYVVSFDGNGATGGSVPGAQTKTDGVDLVVASNSGSLVREGYTFAGWNSQADGDGTAYAEGATYTTDAAVTLYAQWTGNPLTVTYDAQGGSAVSDGSSVSGGLVAEAPESPALADHTFGGWFTSSSGGTAITFPYAHGQTADFTLYAQWALNTYSVSFDGNGATGGAVPGAQAKTHGVDLTVASNSGSLVREGYTFAGWNSQADGDGTAYAEGATYATDAALILYAQWAGNPLTVTYDAQGGSAVSGGSSVSGGSVAEAPDTPIRAGFTFVGWFIASSGGAAVSFPYPHGQNADFTLYAQWVQSSLYGLGSVTKIGTITTVDGVGNTFSADASSSSVSLRYPAGGLPASTVIDVYLVNDLSRAQGLVADDGNFIVSLVVAWLAADGTVPSTATGKPLSMTITNSTILAGAKTYAIVSGQVTLLGTAEVDGSVTISITEDPEIVVVNPSSSPITTSPPPAGGGGGWGGQPPSSVQPPSTVAPPSTTPVPPAQPGVDVISSLPTTDLFVPAIVFPGQPVTVVHSGFTPGEVVDAYVASTPRLVGSATTDENGRVELTVAIPAGLVGQHSLVLYEPSSGMTVRQEISIEPLALPVTGPNETNTDFVVSLALFLLVLGVLGREIDKKSRISRPRSPGIN